MSIKTWWATKRRIARHKSLCYKYGICRVHGDLMFMEGGYEAHWVCKSCIADNEAKNIHREKVNHLERIRVQEQIKKELAPKKEFI